MRYILAHIRAVLYGGEGQGGVDLLRFSDLIMFLILILIFVVAENSSKYVYK